MGDACIQLSLEGRSTPSTKVQNRFNPRSQCSPVEQPEFGPSRRRRGHAQTPERVSPEAAQGTARPCAAEAPEQGPRVVSPLHKQPGIQSSCTEEDITEYQA